MPFFKVLRTLLGYKGKGNIGWLYQKHVALTATRINAHTTIRHNHTYLLYLHTEHGTRRCVRRAEALVSGYEEVSSLLCHLLVTTSWLSPPAPPSRRGLPVILIRARGAGLQHSDPGTSTLNRHKYSDCLPASLEMVLVINPPSRQYDQQYISPYNML